MALGPMEMEMQGESGYIHNRGRMELGHRLEVAGAPVWRRKSSYLVRGSGKAWKRV